MMNNIGYKNNDIIIILMVYIRINDISVSKQKCHLIRSGRPFIGDVL